MIVGTRTSTLVKEWGRKLNSIDTFASGQLFVSHLAFFEKSEKRQAAPDQEIQLPGYETYLIVMQHVCARALKKEWDQNIDSIDTFASGQLFSRFACFPEAFFLFFLVFYY